MERDETPVPTISASAQLDPETLRFLDQLHRAWSGQASLSTYAQLRDELLLQRDKVDNRVAALSIVAKIACPDALVVDAHWQELLMLARSTEDEGKKRKREYHEVNRLRNYLIVAALWSPPVLVHYGWDKVGQTQMYTLRACATRYPRFLDDVCPRLNCVLLERHRQGIKNGRVKTLNEAPIQISRDLKLSALASATPHCGDELWLTDESGSFSLETGGPSLCQLRPNHFRSYLLTKDCFGVIVARDRGLFQQSCLETHRSPMDSSLVRQSQSLFNEPANILPSRVTTSGLLDTSGGDGLPIICYPHEPSVAPTEIQVFASNAQSDPFMALSPGTCRTPGEHFRMPDGPNNFHSASNYRDHDFSPLCLSDSISEPSVLSRDGSPSEGDAFTSDTSRLNTSCGSDEEMQFTLETESDFVSDPSSGSGIEMTDLLGRGASRLISDRPAVSKKRQHVEAKAVALAHARPKTGMLRPARSGQAKRKAGNLLRRSNPTIIPPSVSTEIPPTMEEALQSRYRDLLVDYAAKVAKEARSTDASQQRKSRTQWFNSTTKWASVWTYSQGELPRGSAPSADEAEVFYCTSDEFIRAVQNDRTFNKPVIIKEKFMDSGMHTIDNIASLLSDALGDAVIKIKRLDSFQPARMPVDEFVTGMKTNRLDSIHSLNLRSITNCHRPLFTILPRFRLLKSLVARVEGGGLGRRAASAPVDAADCTSFSRLELAGAFSGPHLDSWRGTWLRNLAGIKLCVIIPQENMESKGDRFTECNQNWPPNEGQRLILLEHDDVLLLHPALRVVHAMYSPTNSLMEGGFFWDELNVIETLESVQWICKAQATANEPIACKLPYIVRELEKLVKDQPDRFRGQVSKLDFLRRFDKAVLSLKELGCHCPQQNCDELCKCRQEGRCCTVWCTDHQQIGHLSCTRSTVTD